MKTKQPTRLEKKDGFILALAQYLAGNQALKSIQLEAGQASARE